jgi:tetratricopeptide (TPR) repeat protein
MARRGDPARLLLLGTYRPAEALGPGQQLRTVLAELQQHGQCAEVALQALDAEEVTTYLTQRFGNARLAATLGRVLHQRTGGNPLFLHAFTDELVRQQVVMEHAEGWELRAEVDACTAIIPAHLRTLIEHQLAQLNPEDQRLIEAASVAGVECTAAAVAAGLQRDEEEVEARCAALAQPGQFLQARGHATWPDGTVTDAYGFRHALYQEVVYQRLPAGRQRRWHARIGARLEQGFGEEAGDMAAVVAMHCVRGHMWLQAMPYLRQAGQQAARRAAFQQAVAFYEQALQVLEQLPTIPETQAQAIDLRLDLRTALLPLGEFGRILDYLSEAEMMAAALDDRYRLGQVADYMTNYFVSMGDYDQAITSGQRTLALATALGDFALQVRVHQHLGRAYLASGAYHQAANLLRWNVTSLQGELLRERFGALHPLAVQSRSWLILCLAELGEFPEGIARGQEGLHMAEESEQSYSRLDVWTRVGILYVRKGDLHQAIPLLERSLALCQVVHAPLLFPPCAATLGQAYALVGRVTEAVPLLEQAVERNTAMGFLFRMALTLTTLSQVYLRVGRSADASALARRALALSCEHKERGSQAWALRVMGEIAAYGNQPDAAQAALYYRQALALAEELGMRPLQAHCHDGLGTLYLKIGQRERARTALSTAITLYRAMAMTFWLPPAEAALALCNQRGETV